MSWTASPHILCCAPSRIRSPTSVVRQQKLSWMRILMLLLKVDKLPLGSVRRYCLLDETTMAYTHCLEIGCRIDSWHLRDLSKRRQRFLWWYTSFARWLCTPLRQTMSTTIFLCRSQKELRFSCPIANTAYSVLRTNWMLWQQEQENQRRILISWENPVGSYSTAWIF